jgi:probable HAF family extracellular repeat protein
VCLIGLLVWTDSANADLQVTEFRPLPFGSVSIAYGINESGTVVGESSQVFGGNRAIRASVGSDPISLGTLQGGWSSVALGINALGHVVGRSQTFVTGLGMTTRAFRTVDDGSLIDLGTLAGATSSEARAISNTGFVVGTSYDRMGQSRAVRWNPDGTIRAIVGLSLGTSAAFDVNDRGDVVGWAVNAEGIRRAFLADGAGVEPGRAVDLGALVPNGWSEAYGINASGAITGAAQSASGQSHAFYYSAGGGMLDIHDSSLGISSYGFDINIRGEVVGRIETSQGSRAFFWSPDAGMVDLNRLIAPDSGWILHAAYGINSLGQVVGLGTYQGRTRGFILRVRTGSGGQSAVPEPSTALLAVTGVVLLAGLSRSRVARRHENGLGTVGGSPYVERGAVPGSGSARLS